jgi:hypothetical protein
MRLAVVAALVLSACGRAPSRTETSRDSGGPPAVASAVAFTQPVAVPETKEAFVATIDKVVEDAIARGEVPGAVVEVWVRDRLLHRRAYGHRRVGPGRVPITADTVF